MKILRDPQNDMDYFVITRDGGREFEIPLYCIVSGIDVCIEEQIVELLHEKHGIEIDTSGEKNSVWKKNLKRRMLDGLNHKGLTIEELISTSGIEYLKSIFPNFCSIFDEL